MKFRCERDLLVDAFSAVSRAVTVRGASLPVLTGVRLDLSGDQLRLTGTDLDLTISVRITVAGGGDGVGVLPAKLTGDIVRALESGAVEVEVGDDEARIVSGRSQFSVRAIAPHEFPKMAAPGDHTVELDAKAFADALRQVVSAASTDESRPILTGVLMAAEGDGLRLVATDSYRLAVRDLRGTSVLSEGQSVLVPSNALKELSRVLNEDTEKIVLRLGERDASFEVGNLQLMTRLIEGEFPNYRGLIPQSHANRLTVGREPLLDALRRVRLLAREATPVRLAMSEGSLEMLAVTQDVGQAQEVIDAKYEGSELTVAFNPEYLIAGIEVSSGDEITLETIDALKPALVRSNEGDDFLYLLMPVRVS